MAPHLPANHPMKAYSEWVINRVDSIYYMQWYLLFAILFLGCTFAIFAYQKFMERKEVKKQTAMVMSLVSQCSLVLSTVRGWVVVHVEEEKKRTEQVEKATQDIKDTLPPATAAAVLQSIEDKAAGDLFDSRTGMRRPPELKPPSGS